MNTCFMDYVENGNDSYGYVATWKMFDGEKSRMYHMTMTKDVCKKR